MKDNLVYDHFQKKWLSFEPTESWLHRKEVHNTIKSILAGALVSVIMAFMVLVIALGLWGK